jgi:hypothetical protein
VVFRDGALLPAPNITRFNGAEAYLALAPAAYKVFAFDSTEMSDYTTDLAVLTKYASKAASVTVSANANSSVIVDVIHLGE